MPLWITQRSDKLPSNYKTQETVKTASLRSLLRQQETAGGKKKNMSIQEILVKIPGAQHASECSEYWQILTRALAAYYDCFAKS